MIKKIFDEISAEGGSNKKMDILRSYKDNKLLERALYQANSKRVKFYVKQIPAYAPAEVPSLDLQVAIDELELLSERKLTGHAAIEHLTRVLSNVNADDAYIIERIIEKDCKIGMGTSNINKVFLGLIEDTPYMGAKAYDIDLVRSILTIMNESDGAVSQIKMDGRYCNAIIRSGDVDLESRQGEATLLEGAKFVEELKTLSDQVLNGELTMDGISRYESNGIIASLVSIGKKKQLGEDISKEMAKIKAKHMGYQEALDKIVFTVWDRITVDEYFDFKSSTAYKHRLSFLESMLHVVNLSQVRMVVSKNVHTIDEAMKHFHEALEQGLEGTILKNINGTWRDGKPNWQVKFKLEMDVDLKIVGFNYGSGKNEKVISSLNAESSCGKVFTRPTGINEKMMQHITDNQDKLLGTIVEVKCCGLSQDSSGNYALLHPVFKSLRDDKATYDSLEAIISIENMVKGLK